LLIAAGVIGLGYGGVTYWSQDTVAKAGPVEITKETPKTIWVSPALAAVALAGGLALTVVAARSADKA